MLTHVAGQTMRGGSVIRTQGHLQGRGGIWGGRGETATAVCAACSRAGEGAGPWLVPNTFFSPAACRSLANASHQLNPCGIQVTREPWKGNSSEDEGKTDSKAEVT